MLPKPKFLAGFTLQEVGGPPIDERPTRPDSSPMAASSISAIRRTRLGQAGNFQNREQNRLHSVSVTDDGERVYVAGTTAGFYVLDSEAIAHHTRCELAAGTAGCNQRSTIVVGQRRHRRGEAAGARQRLPAHGRQQRPGPEGVSGVERVARGEGARYLVLHDALALRRVSAGERVADGHAQRGVRARTGRRGCEATPRAGRRTSG